MGCKQSAVRKQHAALSDVIDKTDLSNDSENKEHTPTPVAVYERNTIHEKQKTQNTSAYAASQDIACLVEVSPLRLIGTTTPPLHYTANNAVTDITVSGTSEASPFIDKSHTRITDACIHSGTALDFTEVQVECNNNSTPTDSECISVSSMTSPGRSIDTVEVVLQRSLNLPKLKKAGCVTVPSSCPQTRPACRTSPTLEKIVMPNTMQEGRYDNNITETAPYSPLSLLATGTTTTVEAHETQHVHKAHHVRHISRRNAAALSNAEIVSTIRNTSPVQLKSCLRT